MGVEKRVAPLAPSKNSSRLRVKTSSRKTAALMAALRSLNMDGSDRYRRPHLSIAPNAG